jgi:hypothetical protein
MVRKQQKSDPGGITALEALEKETESEVKKVNDIRKKEFDAEMDSAFYFSVVFDSRKERDLWLKDHKISLEEDFFVKAKDFIA